MEFVLDRQAEGSGATSGPHQNGHGVGRCDFVMLMEEGLGFYYSKGFWREVWVNFSSMWEPACFGLSVMCTLSPLIPTAYEEHVEGKQASD